MKRYIGFFQEYYYPNGGAYDILLHSDNIEEIELAIKKELEEYCHAHIYDCHEEKIIKEFK